MKSSKWWAAVPLVLIGLLAMASSAMASEPYGLEQEGKPLPLRSVVRLRNESPLILYSTKTGNITCATGAFSMYGIVIVNEAKPFAKLVEGGPAETASCQSSSGGTLRIKNIKVVEFTIYRGSAAMKLTYEDETVPGVTCKWGGLMSFGFNVGTSKMHMNYSELQREPVACGPRAMEGNFAVTSAGKPVVVN